MLLFQSYNIVFQEVPNEVTLAINIANCPNRCYGCHSPHLQKNEGDILDKSTIDLLIEKYGNSITCICFMGGDAAPHEVEQLALYIKSITSNNIKIAWYSGKNIFPENCSIYSFDFIKIGAYINLLGGLDSPETNQRFYEINNGVITDKTFYFQKKHTLRSELIS